MASPGNLPGRPRERPSRKHGKDAFSRVRGTQFLSAFALGCVSRAGASPVAWIPH
jgi:hypothetical protein